MSGLLVLTIFLPLAGTCAISLLAPLGAKTVRRVALGTSLITLAAACVLAAQFPANGVGSENYAVTEIGWLGAAGLDVRFSVGLDGLGLWLFCLTALLTVTAILVSWKAVTDRAPLFYGMLLALEFGCLGVFTARDIILFYVFFEFTLVPLFFLIGIWGSSERRYAAIKFFLFTLAGSVFTFLGLLALVAWSARYTGQWSFSIPALTDSLREIRAAGNLPLEFQLVVFAALLAGFAIKVPLVPLHTWLPLAHVEAPTAGSVFLAGILLKIGSYGFLRFSLPMLPDATRFLGPVLLWIALAGILYGALLALAQRDIKRLIAYSSVSHLGFCMLGLFALNSLGFFGGTLQMINHGISTGALFALVGMMYERYHTRRIEHLGGLARRMPFLAFFFVLFALSSIGLPGTNGFSGEFLLLLGMFRRAWVEMASPQHMVIAVLALSGVVLGAWYMLWLVQRLLFGPLKEPSEAVQREHSGGAEQRAAASPLAPREGDLSRSESRPGTGTGEARHSREGASPADLCWRERIALVPLAVMVLWIGVYPQFFLSRMSSTLEGLLERSVSAAAPDPGPSRQTAADTSRDKSTASPLSALRAFAVENPAVENVAVETSAVARAPVNDPSLPEAPTP